MSFGSEGVALGLEVGGSFLGGSEFGDFEFFFFGFLFEGGFFFGFAGGLFFLVGGDTEVGDSFLFGSGGRGREMIML